MRFVHWLEWPKIGRNPDYMVRLEHMEEDLKSIPELANIKVGSLFGTKLLDSLLGLTLMVVKEIKIIILKIINKKLHLITLKN